MADVIEETDLVDDDDCRFEWRDSLVSRTTHRCLKSAGHGSLVRKNTRHRCDCGEETWSYEDE